MPDANNPDKWTIMIFFAGDNTLSAHMISQLKAIKDAGFHFNANVLVHFDPNERGAPTRIFEINRKRKEKEIAASAAEHRPPESKIGDGRDPFVRNHAEDAIKPNEMQTQGAIARQLGNILNTKPDQLTAADALDFFLKYCHENFSADHYILFVVGHGMIVGNDAFLPDDNPPTGVTLKTFGKIINDFSTAVRGTGEFELLGLHSCSMSAIEVAYELEGTAKYMMGTQGLSFVGSWPYRQLLKKTFNAIDNRSAVDIPGLMYSLYNLSLYNATDYLSAGYSSDLALCKLSEGSVTSLTEAIQMLSAALQAGVKKPLELELILLAHWRSQSYWQESYSDLFDLCDCLLKLCVADTPEQIAITAACKKLMPLLDQNNSDSVVVYSDFFGPSYQYSHGLSIYFPWTSPAADEDDKTLENYTGYKFTEKLGGQSWLSFLETYWKETRRASRQSENNDTTQSSDPAFRSAEFIFRPDGVLEILSNGKPNPILSNGKPNPIVGDVCSCPSIKNFPKDLAMSSRALEAFK